MTEARNIFRSVIWAGAILIGGAALFSHSPVSADDAPPALRFKSDKNGAGVYWQWLMGKKDASLGDFDRFLGFVEAKVGCDLPQEWSETLLYHFGAHGDEARRLQLSVQLKKSENIKRFGRSFVRDDEEKKTSDDQKSADAKDSYQIKRVKGELTLFADQDIKVNLDDLFRMYGDEVPGSELWKAFRTPKGWIIACPGHIPSEYLLFLIDEKTSEIIWKSNVRATHYPHTYRAWFGGSYHRIMFSMCGDDLAIFGNSIDGHYIEVFELNEGNRKFAAKFQ